MTSVSDPYEPSEHPEGHVATTAVSVEAAVEQILGVLKERDLAPVLAGQRS